MPEGGDDDKKGGLSTPVVVALIGLAGVMTTALFQNWEKLFPHQPPSGAQAQQGADVSTPPKTGAAAGAGAPDKTANAAESVSIAGDWRDSDGYSFLIQQYGETISYRQFHQGKENGSATGTLKGRDLRYRFVTTGEGADSGTCMATLSDDGEHIGGKCTSDGGGPGWDFTIRRGKDSAAFSTQPPPPVYLPPSEPVEVAYQKSMRRAEIIRFGASDMTH